MKAIVFVSTVNNPEEKITLQDNGFAADRDNEIPNDFDLIAAEAAVRLKEQGLLDEVVVFSLGPSQSAVQKVLAMGADRAVYGQCDNVDLTSEIVVETALSAIEPTEDTIWMAGKLGVNFESHHVPQLLADRLGCPCISSAYRIEKKGEKWLITCEDDRGIPVFEVAPPFVVTSELRLAEPRFPSLPNIIKAKKKPVETVEIRISHGTAFKTASLEMAADAHRDCQMISIDEFVQHLKES
ncbi:MAG: hypothetical protein J6A01_01900 [Proteobacteria bacterium]|nr:hypothetical protein [Pseudomonadota bacterium]